MIFAALIAPRDMRIQEGEPNPLGDNEVQVRVKAVGIGGTDLRIYAGIISAKLPLVLGQEFAGVVEKVGKSVKAFSPGDRVAVEPVVRDNSCSYCSAGLYTQCDNLKVFGIHLNGGFSEFVNVPDYTLTKIPKERVTFEDAALIVPAAVASYAIQRAGNLNGASVVIIGAGPIGLSMIQLAKLKGASKIFVAEPIDSRRRLAGKFGAKVALDISSKGFADFLSSETGKPSVDVVLEATGNPDIVNLALSSAKAEGKVIFAGAFGSPSQINMASIVRKDLSVLGSWLYPNSYSSTLDLVAASQLDLRSFITHRAKLADTPQAFVTAREIPEAVKVMVVL